MTIEEGGGLDEAVAIVGMSGRFPGASSVGEFWANLLDGRDSISHFSEDELEVVPGLHAADDEVTATYVRSKGILEGIEEFDARFFGYVPREAEVMDPQHRVFLECAWEALESAGWDPDRYDGNIGVYAGCYIDTYLLANLCSHPEFLARLVDSIQVGSLQTELGNDKDYLATRVSFKLNLRGPSVTVQTACSTSLVAIVQACQSLLTHQSDMVLAGGVTITVPQRKGYYYKEGGMLSPDGSCRAFSDQARGTVFSNGAGVVLLKRLSDALEDGDTIHAVIRGWALNNDGGEKHSYTAPSVEGQAEVIATAQAVAGIDARTVGYIEAHGTATPLGDPIEIAGLTTAFRETTDENGFCAIGSVKTNLGHLDVASGVIGTIKTALALREGILPPSLHFERPNPNIVFEDTPFYVNTERRAWPRDSWPRRAGVSSFGVGGTNAHVVIEEPPPLEPTPGSETAHVLPISAKTPAALEAMAGRLADHLEVSSTSLEDVAFTLQVGRRSFDHRRFVTGFTRQELVDALRSAPSPADSSRRTESEVEVAFLFAGQGAQAPNMGRRLYESGGVYRQALDRCREILRPLLAMDLLDVLHPPTGEEDAAAERLRQTELAQPAIFAVEYALAETWLAKGIEPACLVGHSIGEFTAAALGGVLGLEDALRVVVERGRLMQAMPPGAMVSVRADAETARGLLPEGLEVAAINGPSLVAVAGPTEIVTTWTETLDREGVAWSRLHTSHAFHTHMMEPAAAGLVEAITGTTLGTPSIPIYSTATGRLLSDAEAADPEYWGRQLRRTVQFDGAVRSVSERGPTVMLEVGPGQTLSMLGRHILAGSDGMRCVPSLGPVQAPGDDRRHMASALGSMWLAGVSVPWERAVGTARRIPLPTYPFDRKRHWVDPPGTPGAGLPVASGDGASAGTGPTGAGSDVERLVHRQIEIMRQQLAALSDRS